MAHRTGGKYPLRVVEPNRKQAVIAIVAAIADAVSDAKRIVDRVEKSS
jgi:hypothetical protein